jgi:hypothetical protein
MTGDEARKRLAEIQVGEFRKLQTLAREIGADARKPVSTLADVWRSGNASEQEKAETVLADLGELAVRPWLSVAGAVGGDRGARAALQASRAYREAQQRLLQKLQQMMESPAPVPPPPAAGQTEEKEPPSRECDEAYLFARRLLKADDPERLRPLLRKEFLFMPAPKRDAEIASYRRTGEWAVLVEGEASEPQGKP